MCAATIAHEFNDDLELIVTLQVPPADVVLIVSLGPVLFRIDTSKSLILFSSDAFIQVFALPRKTGLLHHQSAPQKVSRPPILSLLVQ